MQFSNQPPPNELYLSKIQDEADINDSFQIEMD